MTIGLNGMIDSSALYLTGGFVTLVGQGNQSRDEAARHVSYRVMELALLLVATRGAFILQESRLFRIQEGSRFQLKTPVIPLSVEVCSISNASFLFSDEAATVARFDPECKSRWRPSSAADNLQHPFFSPSRDPTYAYLNGFAKHAA